jgi:hypothetical protein
MNTKLITTAFLLTLIFSQVFCQSPSSIGDDDSAPYHRFSFLTTWHSFTNWLGDDIGMYEFHFGYRLSPKDKVGIKAAIWKLYQPLGIPLWNPKLMDKSEYYPGRLREYGGGVFYQRMLWKGLFASVEVMPLKQTYLDLNDKKIDDGFRLYTSYHLGYYIPLFKGRAFIEPQIHCNYWPIDTQYPDGFKEKEKKWNNFFLFEPNVYIGINF